MAGYTTLGELERLSIDDLDLMMMAHNANHEPPPETPSQASRRAGRGR